MIGRLLPLARAALFLLPALAAYALGRIVVAMVGRGFGGIVLP